MIVDKRVVILGVNCRILYHYFEPHDRCDLSIIAYDGSLNTNLEVYDNRTIMIRFRRDGKWKIINTVKNIREGKIEILKFLTNVDYN